MILNDNTKLYECDQQKCRNCNKFDEGCHLTSDIMHAKNPEKWITLADLKATHKIREEK